MSKYKIIEDENITPKDIGEALELDKLAYDDEYIVQIEQCFEWFKKNNQIYIMIRDEERQKIIAYVNMSPVSNQYYELIKSGAYIDTNLPSEAIESYFLPTLYNLYLSSIVIHPDYQNSNLFVKLFNSITQKFLNLGEQDIFFKRIVADAVSEEGKKICELLGMEKLKNSNHESAIYEVSMMPPKFNSKLKSTRELYDFYTKHAEEKGIIKSNMTQTIPRRRGNNTVIDNSKENSGVFISYSSKEIKFAGQICQYLEEHDIKCWIAPRDVDPGANYATQIVQSIRNCSMLVLLASENTNNSNHVSNEVSLAFDNKKPIIPFKIEDVKFSDEYLYFLGRKHWIEAYKDIAGSFNQLLKTINRLASSEAKASSPKENTYSKKSKKNIDFAYKNIKPIETEKIKQNLTETEVVESIVRVAQKHSDSFSHIFDEVRDETINNAELIKIFQSVFEIYRYGKKIEEDHMVDYITRELVGDSDSEVIKISGLSGCGKSLLMQLAFLNTLDLFQKKETRYLPYYFSLSYYEKARYNEDTAYEQVKGLMQNDLDCFINYTRANKDITPIIFIDDIREHNIGKISLEKVLFEIIREERIKKRVIAVDKGLIINRNRLKRVLPIETERVSASIETKSIDTLNEKEAKMFIRNVLKFSKIDISVDLVYTKLIEFKFYNIDMFIVSSLANELLINRLKLSSLSDVYEKWVLKELFGDESKLKSISASIYRYVFDNAYDIEDVNFYHPQWLLIHTHKSFLDFLLSYHLITLLDEYDNSSSYENNPFNLSWTFPIDRFICSFISENYKTQKKLCTIIPLYYNKLSKIQKSNAVFWLSKITFKNLITEITKFLKDEFEKFRGVVKTREIKTNANYHEQFFFRSLCLTLMAYGDLSALDEYLSLLITNDCAHAINRGAISEYYSNKYQIVENETYDLDTNILEGKDAIRILIWKMNASLKNGSSKYSEYNLLTLSTLLQTRIQSNDSKHLIELHAWVEKLISGLKKYQFSPQYVRKQKIEFYFMSVLDDYIEFINSESGFDIGQKMYTKLKSLKDVKRKQWVLSDIDDPESISEHTYSTWLLAMIFLPNELDYEGYSKHEVLNMLLIHDIAEAEVGDESIDNRNDQSELNKKNSVMRKLLVKGSYPNIANLTDYYNVWTGYFRGVNINAKLAHDINIIQSIHTFHEYYLVYPEKFSDEEKKMWIEKKSEMETDIGFEIYEKLIEKNQDFTITTK